MIIKIKRPGKIMKAMLFHSDNTSTHTSSVLMAVVRDSVFERVDTRSKKDTLHILLIWLLSVYQHEKKLLDGNYYHSHEKF